MNNKEVGSFLSEYRKEKIVKAGITLLFLLMLFVAVKTVNELKQFKHIGSEGVQNYITVSGEGEVFAVPDTASFSFSVQAERQTVAEAQASVNERVENILSFLREEGIEEGDIRTSDYSIYPVYDYNQNPPMPRPMPMIDMDSPDRPLSDIAPSNPNLRGYEVRQTITIKVREEERAGQLLSAIGQRGADSVSGLFFEIEDEDELRREARQMAINDAKQKARDLSRDLGVRLTRIVGFHEGRGGYYPMQRMESAQGLGMGDMKAIEIPMGENRIFSSVEIVYEIR